MAALTFAGAASAATVEVRDAVVHVTVIPEDRSDIKVEFIGTNPKLPLRVSTSGGTTVIDGGLDHRIHGCRSRGDHPGAWVLGVGRVEGDQLPKVVVRAPKGVVLTSSGVVIGEIGRSASLDLHDSGCSAWTVADVAGDAVVRESGSGQVRMGSAGRLDVRLSGAAHIHVVEAREGLAATLSGVGGMDVESAAGPVEARVSGMGSVRVAHGHATMLRAGVSGVGDVDFGGTADNLDATISGMGSVRVKQVTGTVTKSVSGIGHVAIDERPS